MKTEAERKKLQRQGWRARHVWIHTDTAVAALLAEGLISDAELNDDAAIDDALGKFVMRHCAVGRLLRDKGARPEVPTPKRPKAKQRSQTKHSPVRRFTPEQIAAYAAHGEIRRADKYGPFITEEKKERARRLEHGHDFSFGSAEALRAGIRHDHRSTFSTGGDGWGPDSLGMSMLPPDWSERGKSGDRDGRNRSRITGPGPKGKKNRRLRRSSS